MKKDIKNSDIESIEVFHPVCPNCGQTEKSNRFRKIAFGGLEWWGSTTMQCLDCKQKFEWGTNNPVSEP